MDNGVYDIRELARKWVEGTITAEEKAYLEKWYAGFDFSELELTDHWASAPKQIKEHILNRLKTSIAAESSVAREINKPPARLRWIKRAAAIAAAVIVLFAIGIFYRYGRPHPNTPTIAIHDIPPGHDGAVLTLGDGSRIVLDSAGNGRIAMQGATQVVRQDGRLSYTQAHTGPSGNAVVFYNTMTTARARQFQLVLPDGSKVWLNAASSITYPTAFTDKERKVEITGEAYFEVEKNPKQPFIVKAENTEIRVLGTHFNVMSYTDEQHQLTTLLEGSVRITKGSNERVIKPGEQALVSAATGALTIQSANTSQAVAWVKGKLSMDNVDVATLMRRVSRWYDVDVSFDGKIPAGQFGGLLKRNVPLSDVLNVLEANGIHTRLEGKIVYVSSK